VVNEPVTKKNTHKERQRVANPRTKAGRSELRRNLQRQYDLEDAPEVWSDDDEGKIVLCPDADTKTDEVRCLYCANM